MNAAELAEAVRATEGLRHKGDLRDILKRVGEYTPAFKGATGGIRIGDDCAAIPDSDGFLLMAIEGFIPTFVQSKPWFAGYCGVMVNVSDVYAMGGRPIAVVDALWSADAESTGQLLLGMLEASRKYAVPIVGGHSNCRVSSSGLAVAVLGRAQSLLSSFAARPGDHLIMAVDLRGAYEEPYPFWNASTSASAERLRADLELLPQLAQEGLCDAAKDISMAGSVGTALMFMESSRVGATLRIDQFPRPHTVRTEAELVRWLLAFPSYGFLLSVRPTYSATVLSRFRERGLDAAVVGDVRAGSKVLLEYQDTSALLWDTSAVDFMLPRSDPRAVERAS